MHENATKISSPQERHTQRTKPSPRRPQDTEGLTDPDEVPEEPDEEEVYVKPGELWVLGKHQLLCGDSTSAQDIARVMDGAKAKLCWTDPPWNVAYGSAHTQAKHRQIANDDLGDKSPEFCRAFCKGIASVTLPGSLLYLAMSAQEWPTIHGALSSAGFHWSSTIIWAKDSLVLSRKDYHTQYEPIWYGWNGEGPRLYPLEDRRQSDLWQIPRPKRPVELEAGQAAPFKGSLCDRECASRIVAKIEAANQMRDRCYDELKVKPSSGSSLFVAGLAGAGFLAGLVVGGIVVAKVKK